MAEIVNPYIAGAPVTESSMFFGREDVFEWIENSLAGRYADHILVIHGQRRVGKTSVLKQLGNRLPKQYIPVFFDLQGRTHTTLDRFLWWLAREVVRALKQEGGAELPIVEHADFAKDPEYFESRFLTELQPHIGDRTLLLTFDEFDNLEESEVKEELAGPLVDYLRRMMGTQGLTFIFSIGSSGRKLENMRATYTEFFKTALYKKISFLNQEQIRGLVTQPVVGVLEYEPRAVDRIYQIAGGHPYFTQLTCHELFAKCQRTNERRITESDVDSVLEDVIERGTVNLKFVWDEASDIEKWGLAALARLERTDSRSLADYLRKQRVRFSETELTSGLLHLQEKDVLTADNRFVIHLLKLWLQKNRPMEQAREELTEVNPIANRYIEIGLEFKDAGAYEKAIGSFREALAVAGDNVQAQVNIGLTYMDQKEYPAAIAEFEKALIMDDEDVSARAGLCEAQLALGDTALQRGRTKEAVQSFQRVLQINVEHTEARGRMAEIMRQRAEKALSDGKDEDALSAFAEALSFTPEDPALIERADQVRAEKRAKVLAAQAARSEREASAGNWEKALAALNEALEIAPNDPSVLERITEMRSRQLKERLSAILAQADQAEKSGRWDVAIAALREYLTLNADDREIQKRLSGLIEAKRSIWLKAVMTRTDQAVGAQKWDEALAALNEVLSLDPQNTEIRNKADEVRRAQQAARLQALLRQAAQAEQASRWDEAIEALNGASGLGPQDEGIRASLERVLAAKRVARLKAGMRLADTAAQSGKWNVAIDSLNEILSIEPDNHEVQSKLKEARARQRETRLKALQAQARTLARAERFDEALTAWQEYVSLEPEDRDQAEAEIVSVQKAQAAAQTYRAAQKAFSAKNYEKAVGLFKSIIVEDSEYKDATRLMAEAVELRRKARKWWQSRWLWGAAGGLAVLMGAWVAVRPGSPIMRALLPPQPAATPAQAMAAPARATSTAVPTAMPTAVPLTWARLNSGQFLPRDTITAILIDPTDPGVIYVGAESAGVFKSLDGGLSWQPSQSGLGRASIYSLAMDPQDRKTLFAGTLGGVYKTTDGGVRWSLVTGDLEPGRERTSIVAVNPAGGGHLFYTQTNQLYESADGGGTWNSISSQECPQTIVDLAMDPKHASVLYASNDKAPEDTCDAGIYASGDGGRTWKFISTDLALPPGESDDSIGWRLAVGSSEEPALIAYHPVAGMHRFDAASETWSSVPAPSCEVLALGQSADTADYCYGENALWISRDNGASWQRLYSPPTSIRAIAVSPHSNETLLLGGFGIWRSTDGGGSFDERSSGLGGFRFELGIDSAEPSAILLQVGASCSFYRSSDGARTWEQVVDHSCYMGLASAPPTRPIDADPELAFVHPVIPGKWFAMYGRDHSPHLYVSDDSGQSWHAAADMGSIADGKLFFDQDRGQRVYAIGDVDGFRSDDAGETWQACTPTGAQSARAASRLLVDPTTADHLILATRGNGVLISKDGCGSWNASNTGLGSLFVNTIAADPINSETIYAGTDGGAFVSFDGGQTWGQINEGLPAATVVYSVAVDRDSNVYAATPYGIFKLEAR